MPQQAAINRGPIGGPIQAPKPQLQNPMYYQPGIPMQVSDFDEIFEDDD